MNPHINNMSSFLVMDVLEKAQDMESQGINIIHLEVGEPDFNLPKCLADAGCESYKQNRTHYTHSLGDPEFRAAIADFYKTEYDVSVSPQQIIVTSGSSPAILMALLLLCETGSEVIFSDPGYSCYRNFVLACHATPINIRLYAENGFQYNTNDIRKVITPKTRAIIINSPMNPTGTLLDEKIMKELTSFNIPIISDEIYHGLVYKGKAHSILEFTDKAFVVNGFSKRFAMTGLRLGYLIAPKEHMHSLQKIQQNLFICAPSTAQRVGITALKEAQTDVENMRQIYNERRLYMISRLQKMGFIIHTEPQGAFYVFADAHKFTSDSYHFAFDVLEKAHVGITPGVDFGKYGEGFIRFSYANSLENIKTGMDRLEKYLL